MKPIKILYEGGEGEIVEKKSRFIATVRPVETEEEALAFIAEMKKKYWNATHNCSAFVIGENQNLQRCSDDGEPQGTAGRPMLDVLLGEEIHNLAVVVTRYFGGTLLGTGGLVRAYSKAVQEGLKHCVIIEKQQGFLLKMNTDYNGVGKIQYILGKRKNPDHFVGVCGGRHPGSFGSGRRAGKGEGGDHGGDQRKDNLPGRNPCSVCIYGWGTADLLKSVLALQAGKKALQWEAVSRKV